MKSIIYTRKSTDRDDKQANSLEHQLNNCRNIAERFRLEIYSELSESRSAKDEFTREQFNEMINICKKGKIDYIVVDEPKRLSRNNIDTSRIIDLMDKKLIKGVIMSNREFYTEHSRDKLFLQFDLSLSKMDNEDRAKDVKDKMKTALSKGQWVGKAPDGYKNITIRKGHKDIEVNGPRAKFIRRMFELRAEGYSIAKICDILGCEGFTNQNGSIIKFEVMKKKLQNRFYIGIMDWDGVEYQGKHEPLVSKSLFYKCQNMQAKRLYTFKKGDFAFSSLLKTTDGLIMRGGRTKGHVYYSNSVKSEQKLNISEKKILEQAHIIFKERELPDLAKKIALSALEQMYKNALKLEQRDTDSFKSDIDSLKDRKNRLVDSFLDGDIEKDLYKEKLQQIETQISILEEKSQDKKGFDTKKLKKIQEVAELLFSAYSRESELTVEQRIKILKNLVAELFITNKKELQIANSKLIETLQKLNNHFWYSHGELNSDLSLEKAAS